MILTGKCMQNSCQNYSTKTSGQSFLSKSCSSLFARLGRSIFFFFLPRETFKVCWIKIYLAAATAFLRCHYFCCPSHFSYFLAFCSLYFRWNNLGYKVFIVLEILVQSLYILAIRLLGFINFSVIVWIWPKKYSYVKSEN